MRRTHTSSAAAGSSRAWGQVIRWPLSPDALHTQSCACCGQRAARHTIRVARTMAPATVMAAALCIPLLVVAPVWLTWQPFDLYSVVAGEVKFSVRVRQWLVALPILVPLAWGVCLSLLDAGLPWLGLSLRTCARCRFKHRVWTAVRLVANPLLMGGIAGAVYILGVLPLDERHWGVLFTPWAVWILFLHHAAWVGGVRCRPAVNGGRVILGARKLMEVLEQEQPAVLQSAPLTVHVPSRTALLGWLLPTAVAILLHLTPRLESYPHRCPFGTFPLSHRSGVARLVGCHAPDGQRHGFMKGAPGGWNSSSPLGFAGKWFFGSPTGPFQFPDAKGVVRVRGNFRTGREAGQWLLYDPQGRLLEEIDAEHVPGRVVLAHPHLVCPPGTSPVLQGTPLYGERCCQGAAEPVGPFVMVRNGVVAQVGSRPVR